MVYLTAVFMFSSTEVSAMSYGYLWQHWYWHIHVKRTSGIMTGKLPHEMMFLYS